MRKKATQFFSWYHACKPAFALVLMLLISGLAKAQVNATYGFSATSGTYSEITGGTVLGTTTNDSQIFSNSTTGSTSAVTATGFPIGFSFTYNGATYDNFAVNTNGWILLGNGTFTCGASTLPLSTTTVSGFANVISGFTRDLQGQTGSELSYATVGTAPNRTLVVQWKNYRKYLATGDAYNFQIRLNEAGGVATAQTVQIVYGTFTNNATATTGQVGLRGANNADYFNRTSTTSWAASAAGTANTATMALTATNFPASGLTYTFTPQTCYKVNGLVATNVTTNSVDISWNPAASSASSYSVFYNTTGVDPVGSTAPLKTNIAATTTNLSGLTPATVYYYWVRTVCSSTDSSDWSARGTFVTSCVPTTTFSQNFDAVTAGTWPPCWAKVGVPGSAYTQASTAISAPNNLYIYSTSATAIAMVAMPPVSNADAGTHRLNFKARSNVTVGGKIEVGYLTNPSDSSTFVALATFTTTSTTVVDNFSLSPVQTPSGVTTLAFRHTGSPANSVLIDDVVYEAIPTCDIPTSVSFSNIASTTADVTWNVPAAGNSPVSYSIYYSTTNTAPALTAAPTNSGIVNTTYSLSGLTPNTTYYLWIRSKCSATDSSAWGNMVTFKTACTPVATLPWTEGFEGVATTGVAVFPDCWASQVISGTNMGTSTNNDTYRAPRTGTKYAYSQWSSTVWMYTPGFQLTVGVSYDFSFYMMNKNGTAGFTMDVAYGTNAAAADMSNVLETSYAAGNTTYQLFKYSFTPSSTGVYYIGVKSTATSSSPWYLSFDDFKLELTPSCSAPTAPVASNITSSGAQLDWVAPTAGSAPSSYSVYYSTSATAPALAAAPSIAGITNTTVNIAGLTANTVYYAWVRSKCSASDSSAWAGPVIFTTKCLPTNVPYTQDFESVTVPALPSCTSIEKFGNGNDWTTNSPAANGFTTKVLRYSYNVSAAADAWFYTAGINLTANVSYRISYKYGNNSTTYTEKMEVKYGDAAAVAAMVNTIADHPSIVGGAPATNTVDFTPSTTGVYYFGFHAYSTANQFYLYVDDISIMATPTCDAPTGITSSNVTPNAIDLSWNAPAIGTANSYSIYVGTSATPPATTAAPTIAGIANTNYTISNLTPATNYYIWIRSKCSATDSSIWSTPLMVTTACAPVTAPSANAQNFDVFAPNCWQRAQGFPGQTMTTVTTASNWVQDDFGNVVTPVNKSAKINIYTTNRKDWLITPSYDLGNNGAAFALDFDLALTTYSVTTANTLDPDDKFEVYISTDDGATWSPSNLLRAWGNATTISNTGEHISIPLTGYSGVVKFGFYGESTVSGADNDLFVDNVNVVANTLPVTFTAFTGERRGNANQLSWSTATESNNKGFELQRSVDGTTYTSISFVNSKAENGNSNQTLNYAYTDEKIAATASYYYRLKQVDKDGKYNYSNAVFIKGAKATKLELVSVYPNPAKDQLNISIASPKADNVTFIVTDMTGKVVLQQRKLVANGDNLLQLNVQTLSQGSYLLKAICADGCETAVSKFMKN